MSETIIWDTHIHLDQYPKEKIPCDMENWQEGGVAGIIAVATDLRLSYKLLEWKIKYSDFLHIALGYHPEQQLPNNQDLLELLSLIQAEQKRVIGIGEVGRDYL